MDELHATYYYVDREVKSLKLRFERLFAQKRIPPSSRVAIMPAKEHRSHR